MTFPDGDAGGNGDTLHERVRALNASRGQRAGRGRRPGTSAPPSPDRLGGTRSGGAGAWGVRQNTRSAGDPKQQGLRPRRRRKRSGGNLVVISWRDIPAQVNGGSGAARVQRILPRRFQTAIDRAAMVAGKTHASDYVGEWRRTVIPGDPSDPEGAALAAATRLEEDFPLQRLNGFVRTGGWDPDRRGNSGDGPSPNFPGSGSAT